MSIVWWVLQGLLDESVSEYCVLVLQGLFSGLAKGVVGTVAKPVAGLFDLASETSAAIRESTSRVSRQQPPPIRHTRCCLGANGALTAFSAAQARGQEYLLRITDGKLSEK